jgi:hypothetical protein
LRNGLRTRNVKETQRGTSSMSPQPPSIARTTGDPKNRSRMPRGRPTPRDGDVLASGRSARTDIHEISIVPAEGHTIVARYAEAIEKVQELARGLRVDGWYTSDQTHYVRVVSYRSLGEGRSPVSSSERTTRD